MSHRLWAWLYVSDTVTQFTESGSFNLDNHHQLWVLESQREQRILAAH